MKSFQNPSRHFRSGFTLVELLVVIAIIAILASVITVAAGSAINAAKRAKAANTATQIETAIASYNTEYGVYPVPTQATPTDVSYSTQSQEAPLMIALCGNINASTATTATSTISNTRNEVFLTPKKSEVDTQGVLINPFSTIAAPQYFFIAMDSDYSGILGDSCTPPPDFSTWTTGTAESAAPTSKITQPIAVWVCCDPAAYTNPTTSTNPTFWPHTY